MHSERRAEEGHQALAGAAAKFAQQLAVVFEMAAKNDGDADDVLPMGNGVENGFFQVLAERRNAAAPRTAPQANR